MVKYSSTDILVPRLNMNEGIRFKGVIILKYFLAFLKIMCSKMELSISPGKDAKMYINVQWENNQDKEVLLL